MMTGKKVGLFLLDHAIEVILIVFDPGAGIWRAQFYVLGQLDEHPARQLLERGYRVWDDHGHHRRTNRPLYRFDRRTCGRNCGTLLP